MHQSIKQVLTVQISVTGLSLNKNHYSTPDLKMFIYELIQQGYLKQTQDQYALLQLTGKSKAVLLGQETVFLTKPEIKTMNYERRTINDINVNNQLFNRLRTIRKRLADEKNVPPYVIFSDASLKEMAIYLPQTKEDFAHIKGVGSQKLQTYADTFIKEIVKFCQEEGIILSATPKKRTSVITSQSAVKERQETALRLFKEGISMQAIANEIGLATSTIGGYIEKAYLAGEPIDIDSLVSLDKQTTIQKAFQQFGTDKLSPVKTHLGEDYTYEDLRLTRAKLMRGK